MFQDRQHAGRRLALAVQAALEHRRVLPGVQTIVVALPRGGVPVAQQVALQLNAPLTILVSKKIGAPFQPELAAGAVSSNGTVVLNPDVCEAFRCEAYVAREKERLLYATKQLENNWLQAAGLQARPSLAGKRVIIVDDGVATGMTTLAAIRAVRAENPESVTLAVPVMPPDTRAVIEPECDCVVCLITAREFRSIGHFYQDFHQVEDAEVVAALAASAAYRHASNAATAQ